MSTINAMTPAIPATFCLKRALSGLSYDDAHFGSMLVEGLEKSVGKLVPSGVAHSWDSNGALSRETLLVPIRVVIDLLGFDAAMKEWAIQCNSYSRLPTLLGFWFHLTDDYQRYRWFEALGDAWTGCDNISRGRSILLSILRRHRAHWPFLMDHEEQEAHKGLPDLVTLYRGCHVKATRGLSWSLDRPMAESFPFRMRYMTSEPVLVTAIVPKNRVIAVKLDRDESEAIAQVFPRDLQAIEALSPERGAQALKILANRSPVDGIDPVRLENLPLDATG